MLIEATLIFLLCLVGSGVTSYSLGKRKGIEGTVEYLVDEGLLEVSDE